MYEDQTYETILERSLDRVATDVDKSEGSVIMNAVAPVSAEHANIYILLDGIIRDGYADTACRDYLVLRCAERGITPYPATNAVLKGKFNMEIPIESRFNLDEINYKAIAFIESKEEPVEPEDEEEEPEMITYYYYQMECETAGTEGNRQFGELEAIDFIDEDLYGELVELLIPAEDEEDTEVLRQRYLNSFKSTPFGGNKQDYREKTDAIEGVGGTVVVPVWNGGGTVKLIIIDSSYNVASGALVSKVQEAIDPDPQGTGSGIAPIGHTVTVVSAVAETINVSCKCTLDDGYSWSQIEAKAKEIIEAYFLDLRKNWENGAVTVRISQIENKLLSLEGVLDVTDTALNGSGSNMALTEDKIPVLGGVTGG